MELKKNPNADLGRFKSLLFEVGLILSLILVIVAFTYTPKEMRIEKVEVDYGPVENEITEITRQEEKTPPPPKKVEVKVIANLLQVVSNDTKIDVEVDFTEFDEEVEIVQQVAEVEEVIEDDIPIFVAQDPATFMGGDLNTFRGWVGKNMEYPVIAQENGITGTVTVEFVIERDGTPGAVKILRSPDKSLSDEVLRLIKMSPKWVPAKHNGKVARQKFIMPVTFKLEG